MKKIIIGLAVLVGILLLTGVEHPEFDQRHPGLSEKQQRIAHFFIKKGVENPVEKAIVISTSKYPKTAAAQAVVESRVNPRAIGKKK